MEIGIKTCVLLNNKFTIIKSTFIVMLILFWAQNASAQKSNITPKHDLRFQLELGCNYSYFPDKNKQFSGIGLLPGWVNYDFIYQGRKRRFASALFGVKAIYKNKHVFSYNSFSFGAVRYFDQPYTTGQYYQQYAVKAFGYGYQFSFSNLNFTINTQLCYRTGMERYNVHFYPTSPYQSNATTGSIGYQKPWGGSLSIQTDYFITNNFGLGLSAGYYFFPFEDAKLKASFLHLYNPKMEATTFPNKGFYHGSLKLFYNFALPKSINKLNPFKKK